MSSRSPWNDESPTVTDVLRAAAPSGRGLRLLVLSGEQVQNIALKPGRYVIGRAEGVDIRIDHPTISRQHARLDVGETVQVEDLGGRVGTKVNNSFIATGQPVPLRPGEVIDLGSATLILQALNSAPARVRQLWTHGHFEARVQDECARAARSASHFVVVRIHTEATLNEERFRVELDRSVRTFDVAARYGPSEYEVLLVDSGEAVARQVIARMEKDLRAAGGSFSFGFAVFPEQGRSCETLIEAAGDALKGALHGGRDASIGAVVVEDPAMQRLFALAGRIASSTLSVLLLGETGVGKEVFAESIHQRSPRSGKPFLKINCAALNETLLESELFGHERGAFTGALTQKLGLLETADGGTVMLDEVGDMPLSVQAKLLRTLEDRQVTRVGGLKAKPLDVRFIAATNRDLEEDARHGRFRSDLYFRLSAVPLVIPPLRERLGEIAGLARFFVTHACQQSNRRVLPALVPETLAVMHQYSWPGNIRELRNVIERAVLLCEVGPILPEHLPLERMTSPTYRIPSRVSSPVAGGNPTQPEEPPAAARDDAAERARIIAALEQCGGNQTRAAVLLGVSRRTLVYRLAALQIPRARAKGLKA